MELGLAINGKLVEQDPYDEPASELLGRIAGEKAKLVKMGLLKKSKPLAPIIDEPYKMPSSCTCIWTRLGNVQICANGYAFKSTEYQNDGIGIVRIGDIQDGQISMNGMKFFPVSQTEEFDERLLVKPRELLIVISGVTTEKLRFNKT